MKLLSVFRKSLREQRRDPSGLVLALMGGPFFLFLYWLTFQSTAATYDVLVMPAVPQVQQALSSPTLKATTVTDRTEAERQLKDRAADALVVVGPDFGARGSQVTLVGDLTSQRYLVTAVMVMTALEDYVQEATGEPPLLDMTEVPLGISGARNDFEASVPGLLMISVMMLLYKVAMVLTAEVESGTLRRLQLSRMGALDLLGGITLSQLLTGVVAVLITFGLATAMGFRSQGPLWLAILVTSLTTFSVIGFGLLVACFSRTATEASVVATFPILLLMFFSGAAFPIPKLAVYDLLPPTHGVVALNKVLTLGAGPGEILYELTAVVALSVLYFAAGVWLFHRRHMRVM